MLGPARLPTIFDFGVEAQAAAGKTAEKWVADAEQAASQLAGCAKYAAHQHKIEQILRAENNDWVDGVVNAPPEFNFGVGFEELPVLADDKLSYKFSGKRYSQVTFAAPPAEGFAVPLKMLPTFPWGKNGPMVEETLVFDVFNHGYRMPMRLVFDKLEDGVHVFGDITAGEIKEKMTTSGFWLGTFNNPAVRAPPGEIDYFTLYNALALAFLGLTPATGLQGANAMLKYQPKASDSTALGYELKKHNLQCVLGFGAASAGETSKNAWGDFQPLPEPVWNSEFLAAAEAAWKRAGSTTVSIAYGSFKFTLLGNEIGLMPAFPAPLKDFGSSAFAKQCYMTAHPFI